MLNTFLDSLDQLILDQHTQKPLTGIRVFASHECDCIDLEIVKKGTCVTIITAHPGENSFLEIAKDYFPKEKNPDTPDYSTITWEYDDTFLQEIVEENWKEFPLAD